MFCVREMANGLAYAHRRTDESGRSLALVHCDISPPNVMVSFEGEVKIIDFGIAKSAIRIAETNPNMGFGKFGYMAPEQLIRGGIVDKRTDVYAAGVVLYELLTGERLFTFPEGADYRQIARMVTQGKFKPPSERDPRLDPELDPIVMKALSSNKDERYQTAEEFRDGIQVKLSQMNPTINADALAHFMRGLFRDEITEEHALVASMKAVDVAPFQHELDQATHKHTVTFARASGINRILPRSQPSGSIKRADGGAAARASDAARAVPGRHGGGARRRRRGGDDGGAAGRTWRRRRRRWRRTCRLRRARRSRRQHYPMVTPLEPPSGAGGAADADARRAAAASRGAPARQGQQSGRGAEVDAAAHHSSAARRTRCRPSSAPSRASTRRSSRSTGRCSRTSGTRSPPEITFGKADKFDKVDAMLDALRREMAKVKAGG